MTHPLNGKWTIHAVTPVMKMELVATMNVNEDGKTFEGSVLEVKTGKEYPLENCTVEGNAIEYTIAMRLGLIPLRITMNGTFNDAEGTCEGEGTAMKMHVTYTGERFNG